ncbi:MAG: nicotinate-nucleotide adenylyltransferase [Halioglobus sp.]|nr:nicotinate-nucleotide adenylyltransferase [Halioglobus sp.]
MPDKLEGVFGGTFDPIHYGHLRSALELVERLQLERVRLMPNARPPHRAAPFCSARRRADMVELAVRDEPHLCCDTRELDREGPSYMIDSLQDLHCELGAETALCMVMGCDAVRGISGWHRWQELLDWAHIVILARPGWALPESGEVADWLQQHRFSERGDLRAIGAGGIVIESLRPLEISSTDIRTQLSAGRSARYLLPQSVLAYIDEHSLYRGGVA